MEKVGIALIGCGYWGKNYFKTLRDIEGIELKWICDNQNLPKEHVFPYDRTTNNYARVLEDENVRGVIIATPTKTHYKIALEALQAGKDVLVEKPMASTPTECISMIEHAKKYNRILTPGHIFVHNPAVQKLEEYIQDGMLGDVIKMSASRFSLGPIRTEENAMWDLMPHDISMFLRFKKQLPASVNAMGSSFLGRDVEDDVCLGLRYEDGLMATCEASWVDAEKVRKVRVIGKKKMAVFDDVDLNKLKIYDSGVVDVDKVDPFDYARTAREGDIYIPKISGKPPLEIQCENFVRCIRTREMPRVRPEEGYDVVRILHAAQKSLEGRREIKL